MLPKKQDILSFANQIPSSRTCVHNNLLCGHPSSSHTDTFSRMYFHIVLPNILLCILRRTSAHIQTSAEAKWQQMIRKSFQWDTAVRERKCKSVCVWCPSVWAGVSMRPHSIASAIVMIAVVVIIISVATFLKLHTSTSRCEWMKVVGCRCVVGWTFSPDEFYVQRTQVGSPCLFDCVCAFVCCAMVSRSSPFLRHTYYEECLQLYMASIEILQCIQKMVQSYHTHQCMMCCVCVLYAMTHIGLDYCC